MAVTMGARMQAARRRAPVAGARRGGAVCRAAAADAKKGRQPPGAGKGFVEEMRFVAMRLHTREQAPKEGKKEERPLAQWAPSEEGYVKFLAESKAVYDRMEGLVAAAPADSPYAKFKDTGLERGAALEQDLAWFAERGVEPQEVDGAGKEYAEYLQKLAEEDVPAFICHYYNVYFAHSAGGKMIGAKVSEMLLDGHTLEFYKWEDLQGSLLRTKDVLNATAESWSRDEKDHCLEETDLSFKYSGQIMRYIAS